MIGGNTNIMAEPNTAPERDPTFPMSIVHQDSIDKKGEKTFCANIYQFMIVYL
jgi:hypothetical protein